MSRCTKLEAAARNNPDGLSFAELQRLAECAGYELDRIKGSHHIYRHPTTGDRQNFQPNGRKAKGYQVLQLLKALGEPPG